MSRHDREPIGYICPDIDKLIALAECLRKDNESLRDWGREEADRVDELEARIEELEDQLNDLQRQLDEARAALENS